MMRTASPRRVDKEAERTGAKQARTGPTSSLATDPVALDDNSVMNFRRVNCAGAHDVDIGGGH